jgi:hypothetical protein
VSFGFTGGKQMPNPYFQRLKNWYEKFQTSRAERNKRPVMDRAAESTARATWIIALLTIATIAVGISQYVIFGRQLDVMENQLRQMNNTARPFIYLKSIDTIVESEKNDKLIKWKYTWRNNGVIAGKNLTLWSDCHDDAAVAAISIHKDNKLDFRAFIGPGAEQSFIGCVEHASFIKKTYDVLINKNSGKIKKYYVFGGAKYYDDLGIKHLFEFCQEAWWNNADSDMGFDLVPCIDQNEKYNCTDEECEDYKDD